MEKNFVIAWKSTSEPRWGQGKKLFTREEAEALAEEMNQDYPAFIHEALDLTATAPVVKPEPAIIHVDFQSTPAVAIAVAEETGREAVTA
jgi:hypothetical protein